MRDGLNEVVNDDGLRVGLAGGKYGDLGLIGIDRFSEAGLGWVKWFS